MKPVLGDTDRAARAMASGVETSMDEIRHSPTIPRIDMVPYTMAMVESFIGLFPLVGF